MLTPKQIRFCKEYVIDNNGTQAAIRAGYSKKTANEQSSRLLVNVNIQDKISELQNKISDKLEITSERIAREFEKIAFSSIAHLHNTWIERKEFNELTEDQKDAIQEIDTKVKVEWHYNEEKKKKEPIEVEYIKVKLFDKVKALENLGKHIGFYEEDNKQKNKESELSDEERRLRILELRKKLNIG